MNIFLPGLGQDFGRRFTITGTVPALLVVLAVLAEVGAGAPDTVSGQCLTDFFDGLTGVQWALVSFGVFVLTLVLQPVQFALVRLLEGYPLLAGPLRVFGLPMQRRWLTRWDRFHEAQRTESPDKADSARMYAAAAALDVLPARRERVLPTRLGNGLRAAEDRSMERYGLDLVAVWPMLSCLLSDRLASATDDARDQLDASCRFSTAFALVSVTSAVLLPGWWRLGVVAVSVALTVLAYRSAVAAARVYGDLLNAAVALHRFDLLKALHLPLPGDAEQERCVFIAVSRHARQGWPLAGEYLHEKG